MEPDEEVMAIPLREEDKTMKVGSLLKEDKVKQIHQVLLNNAYMFAWTVTDIPRVDLNVMTHKLSIFK